jgi:hypothetical protein
VDLNSDDIVGYVPKQSSAMPVVDEVFRPDPDAVKKLKDALIAIASEERSKASENSRGRRPLCPPEPFPLWRINEILTTYADGEDMELLLQDSEEDCRRFTHAMAQAVSEITVEEPVEVVEPEEVGVDAMPYVDGDEETFGVGGGDEGAAVGEGQEAAAGEGTIKVAKMFQVQAWLTLLRGQSAVVLAGTGEGKSLIMLMLIVSYMFKDDSSVILVIEPLRSIMRDQAAAFTRAGIPCFWYDSEQAKEENYLVRVSTSLVVTKPLSYP